MYNFIICLRKACTMCGHEDIGSRGSIQLKTLDWNSYNLNEQHSIDMKGILKEELIVFGER